VYIVEDHAAFSEKLAALLDNLPGVTVVGRADNVLTGLDRLRALHPDVSIMDVRLPPSSGFDLLAAVKCSTIPPVTVMMTGYADPEYRERSMALGADFFFEKATGLKDMLKAIKSLRDRKRLQVVTGVSTV